MIISTIEELRLYATAHALDSIEPLTGTLNSTEYENLRPLLGQPLYDRLCTYYGLLRDQQTATEPTSFGDTARGIAAAIERQRQNQPDTYWERLLFLCQPVVAFKTIESAIALQVLSINNAGINYATADDYPKADEKGIQIARNENLARHHAAANQLLEELECWYQQAPTAEDATQEDADLYEIATLWRQSRYFYLAAQMLLPSARIMHEYLDIMDSREKFIRLLPDIRYVQEEQIAPAIGEDFLDYLIHYALRTEIPASSDAATVLGGSAAENGATSRLVHRLRKIAATFVEGRTTVLKIDKDRKIAAHDEAVMLLGRLCDQIRAQQTAILLALDPTLTADTAAQAIPATSPAYVFALSPLYTAPAATTEATVPDGSPSGCSCQSTDSAFKNNSRDAALFLTPPLL